MVGKENYLAHLDYIRNELLSYDEIQLAMTGLKFLPPKIGLNYRNANECFSPFNKLFMAMCQADIPPKPFCTEEWTEFMELAGMIYEVTEELVVNFAFIIERNEIMNNEGEIQSRLFLTELLNMEAPKRKLLTKLSIIRFVTPSVVPDNYASI